jgi:hypothetical protein
MNETGVSIFNYIFVRILLNCSVCAQYHGLEQPASSNTRRHQERTIS